MVMGHINIIRKYGLQSAVIVAGEEKGPSGWVIGGISRTGMKAFTATIFKSAQSKVTGINGLTGASLDEVIQKIEKANSAGAVNITI